MSLLSHQYGKKKVRLLRLRRDGRRHTVSETDVSVMLNGDFSHNFIQADNRGVVLTDTMKNIVQVVGSESIDSEIEDFASAIGERLLDTYPQVQRVKVVATETPWQRRDDHDHCFALGGGGRPVARVAMTREAIRTVSGIRDLVVMKTTEAGFAGYAKDTYTVLPESNDRIVGTTIEGRWLWRDRPAAYAAANRAIVATMLDVFADTFSASVQDSLYRMGEAALARVPEVAEISLVMPNLHYLPIDLTRFGRAASTAVLLPTSEPHGQIEATIGRD